MTPSAECAEDGNDEAREPIFLATSFKVLIN
jgi:hypothetical protein